MLTHLGTQTIQTKRLLLRPYRAEDAKDMYENWASDDEVTQYLSWPSHKSIEISQKVLSSWLPNYESKNNYNWGIEHEGRVIGNIAGVSVIDETLCVEIGYSLGRAFWGKGIMTEALQALLSFFFDQVGMTRVFARHAVQNIGSGRVMEKAGMVYEGTLRRSKLAKDGTLYDMVYRSMLKEEWQRHKAANP